MKQLNIIAACSENRVIGRAGRLPWKINEDWNYFIRKTKGGTIIFGRKAFEEFGYPFSGSQTIVLTHNHEWRCKDVIVATSLQDALNRAQELGNEIWIGGGQHVYEETITMLRLKWIFISLYGILFSQKQFLGMKAETTIFVILFLFLQNNLSKRG